MHVFERQARNRLEASLKRTAALLGCDIAHVIHLAAGQLDVIHENVEKGRADDPSDLIAARQEVPAEAQPAQEVTEQRSILQRMRDARLGSKLEEEQLAQEGRRSCEKRPTLERVGRTGEAAQNLLEMGKGSCWS